MQGTAMIDETLTRAPNVIDLTRCQQMRRVTVGPRLCRFCGAGLDDGEREEDCSGAWPGLALPAPVALRRFRAE